MIDPIVQVAPIGAGWVYRLFVEGWSIKSEGFPFETRGEAEAAAFERVLLEQQRTEALELVYKWETVEPMDKPDYE